MSGIPAVPAGSTVPAGSAIPALPPRTSQTVGPLPVPFRDAQVDALPNSVCWFDGSWLVSTDAWQDRRLGRLDPASGRWRRIGTPAGWARQPWTDHDGVLAVLVHDRNADTGRLVTWRSGRWDGVADDVGIDTVTDWDGVRIASRDRIGQAGALTRSGEAIRVERSGARQQITIGGPEAVIPLPDGATVTQLAPSPDRERMVVVVRRGAAYQTLVCCLRTARPLGHSPFRGPVHGRPVWWDDERILVVLERWPSLVPVVWHWRCGRCEEPWPASMLGTVRSAAVAPGGRCVVALTAPLAARHLRALDDLPAAATAPADREVRTVVVRRGDQALPCLVYEPSSAPRGTVLYFPGGPHEPMWAEHSPFSLALNDDGWRVVRVNVRSSGLREPQFRPVGPVLLGVDDVRDALAVIEALGDGPVVTMGMSYGGYLATLAGERSERCRAIVVLSGFLSRRDLDRSRHPQVRRFAAEAFTAVPPEPSRLTKPFFVVHGSKDPRVPIEVVRDHQNRASGRFTFLELTGQGHAILSDHDARLTYPELLSWLRTNVPLPARGRSRSAGPT